MVFSVVQPGRGLVPQTVLPKSPQALSAELTATDDLAQSPSASRSASVGVPSSKVVLSQRPGVRFAGTLNEDYHVELRVGEPVNPTTSSAMLRALLMRHLLKKEKNDTSSLKLFLDGSYSDWFMGTSRATLADMLTLVPRPVDVVVKENVSSEGLMALLSATGKRLMYEHAYVSMGPVTAGAPYMRNDDHAVRREFQNDYTRDLEALIMDKTGVTDRSKLYYDDLNRAYNKNSLQSLYYGTKGLVDGVLVGYDQVVTRDSLNQYIADQNLSGVELTRFLNQTTNIRLIPSVPLATFSPESIPNGEAGGKLKEVSLYVDPATADVKAEAEKAKKEADKAIQDKAKTAYEEAKEKWERQLKSPSNKVRSQFQKRLAALKPPAVEPPKADEPKKEGHTAAFTIFAETPETAAAKILPEKIGLKARIKEANVKAQRTNMTQLPGERSFLEDDVIFFNDGFVDESAEQITDALSALDIKKRQDKNPSNVKILVNSPGGSIWAGMDIRSTINQMKSKVDVIVTGMAASCGAYLVSSATGLRMATPNARIMIHDAWWSLGSQSDMHYNDRIDYLDRSTRNFVEAIATASGRPFPDVWEDMKIDVWLNPLESMFYGDKGLTDAVLVGQDKVITKADVKNHLLTQYFSGDEAALSQYVADKMQGLRGGKRSWKPEEHNEADPFANPLKVIQTVAAQSAKPIKEAQALKASVPDSTTSVNHYVISLKPTKAGSGGTVEALSSQSQAVLEQLQQRWAPAIPGQKP